MSGEWPDWWAWELELTPHLEKRMEDRGFDEIELRTMLQQAGHWRPDHVAGRFAIECRLRGLPWQVIVEPDPEDKLLVVITAYRVEQQ